MKLTIQKKIVLSLTSLTLIPLVLICIYLGINIYNTTLSSFRDASTREIKQIETAFEFFFNDLKENINFLTQAPVIKESKGKMTSYLNTKRPQKIAVSKAGQDAVEIENFLQRFINTHNAYVEVYAGSQEGEMILATQNSLPAGYDPRKRPWYKDALQSDNPIVTDPYLSTSGEITISVAKSFKRNDSVQGVAGIDVSLTVLTSIIENIKIGKSGFMMLAKKDGTVLANPQDSDTIFKNLKDITKPGYKKLVSKSQKITLGSKEYFSVYYTSNALGWNFIGLIPQNEVTSGVNNFLLSMVLIASVFFLIAVGIGLILAKKIIKPISKTTEILSEIAEGDGDLTMRLEVNTNDEIGQLSIWFNTFMDKLQVMIKDISKGVDTLSSSSTELSSISEQMTDGAKETSEKSGNVSVSVEEMTANMNSVSAAMEQSSTNTDTVATAAEEMNSTINEIAQNAEEARGISGNAVKKVEESSQRINQLGEAAKEIGKVVETITDISDQVNLLSLNATIEAARAGEAGKGFAVVANEIKELASQTSKASGDIKSKIENIQQSSSVTMDGISEISDVINNVNDIVSTIATAVEEQSSATREITENINQASTGIQEVNENVNQNSSVAKEIAKDISLVNTSAEDMTARSEEVKTSAVDLSKLAEDLNSLVGRFKV